MGHEYFQGSCQSTHLFPKFPCHQFSNYVTSKSLTTQPNHWPQPMDLVIITYLAISPSSQSAGPGAVPKALPTGLPFTVSLRDVPPLVGGACISIRTTYN